jgi:hypothetical protein
VTADPLWSKTAIANSDLLVAMAAKVQHQAVFMMRNEFGPAGQLLNFDELGYELYEAVTTVKIMNGAGQRRRNLLAARRAQRTAALGRSQTSKRIQANERLYLIRKLQGRVWMSFDDVLLWQVLLGSDFFPEGGMLIPDEVMLKLPQGGRIMSHARRLRGI